MSDFTCVELCAGAGGQALGLEQAGFRHLSLVDMDPHCCRTLKLNRPSWHVLHADLRDMLGRGDLLGRPDLLAGGLPCPPFSVAGKQLGEKDERNLFPTALRLVEELSPRAIMIENVRGFLSSTFESFRASFRKSLRDMGYCVEWRLLNASGFGVSQLRPRVVIVAVDEALRTRFEWPEPLTTPPDTVGATLFDLMSAGGWEGAADWRDMANDIAPTLVGGSSKHGGPDLGPTRAKRAWEKLGVNAHSLAESPPEKGFEGMPRLTVRMAARLQGFPDDWQFSGKKTPAYRQVGNAFPPPVARAVGLQLRKCLASEQEVSVAV